MGRQTHPIRGLAALAACSLVSAIALAGCGGSAGSATGARRRAASHARVTVAAPAGLLAGAAPQPNGTLWVLASTGGARTVDAIDLSTGRQTAAVGVNRAARALAQGSTDILALGLGTAKTGAVQLLDASTGAVTSTIPVGAPVVALAFGDDGATLYVLDGTARTRSVTILDTTSQKITGTIGLPSDARSIAPTPNQEAIWSLQASGTVQETSLTNGKPIESFDSGSPGIALALAPSGGQLYLLKGTGAEANIAVVQAATERVSSVLPGAAHSVGLGVSLDGSQLYDFVGAPSYGNIQILDR